MPGYRRSWCWCLPSVSGRLRPATSPPARSAQKTAPRRAAWSRTRIDARFCSAVFSYGPYHVAQRNDGFKHPVAVMLPIRIVAQVDLRGGVEIGVIPGTGTVVDGALGRGTGVGHDVLFIQ